MSTASEHECPTCDEPFDSAVAVKAHHQNHEKTYYEAAIERKYGVPAEWFVRTQYEVLERSAPEIAEYVGCTVTPLRDMMDRFGVEVQDRRVEIVCKWCGDYRKVPKSREERTVFCDKDCQKAWWSSLKSEVECSYCGRVKEVCAQRAQKYDHHFCSQGCKYDWRSENVVGEDHPNWDKVTVECWRCGMPKKLMRSHAEGWGRHFCSTECREEWQSETLSGKANPMWDGGPVIIECEQCGASMQVPRHREASARFCSKECSATWKSEHFNGSDHPLWRGGYDLYRAILKQLPKSWTIARDEARDRDEHQCRGCGADVGELDRKLDVHHIVKLLAGGTHGDWNLLSLCRSCHTRADRFTDDVCDPVYTDWADDELPDGRLSSHEYMAQVTDGPIAKQATIGAFAD